MPFNKNPYLQYIQAIVALGAFCLLAIYYGQLRFLFNSEIESAALSRLFQWQAATPFQYRVFTLSLAHALQSLLDTNVAVTFLYIEIFFSFLLALMLTVFYNLVLLNWRLSFIYALLFFSLLCFNFLLPRQLPFYYPWDTPQIFFITLGLYCIYTRKTAYFYLTFILCTLNKETSIFLIYFYLVANFRNNHFTTSANAAALFVVWLLIKSLLFMGFSTNNGAGLFQLQHEGTVISHWSTNISLLLDIRQWPFLASQFSFIWLVPFLFLASLKNPFLKYCLYISPVFFFAMLLVGNINEVRIFGELFPVFTACTLVIIQHLHKEKTTAQP